MNVYNCGSIEDTSQPAQRQFGPIHDTYTEDECLLHAAMYGVADRFMLADLKVLARDAFASSWFGGDTAEDDDDAKNPQTYDDAQTKTVIVIYESTPESDRSLRDMVLLS